MALGGLGAFFLAGHPTLSLDHILSKVDLRSVFLAVVIVIIVLVLAYLTNPSEASFRGHLTELHIKQHLRQVDEGIQENHLASDDSGVHFTLSRRFPLSARKSGSNFDPSSPLHFVSRATVSLRTPKHVYHSFGILSIAAVYPASRYGARSNGRTTSSDKLNSSVCDAWYIGAFGHWWKGGVVQSWWHEILESTKDTERCASGLLDVKALDVLEGLDGLSFPTSSRVASDTTKLRGTERPSQRSTNTMTRSTTPPPLPKSASLPLHAPRVPATSPPKTHGASSQRHAPSPAHPSALVASEQLRPPAPPVVAYSPSSTSLWDSSPIIAEVLRQISHSKAAVHELRTQLADFRSSASESHATIQSELESQRGRKREEDGARAELKARTKALEDSKRSAESTKRDAEKRLRAAESARDNAAARIERLGEEIGALRSRVHDDEFAVIKCKEEGEAKEKETQETLAVKRKEIKVAEEVVAALNIRAKELEERIAQEEERLRHAKEQAEMKKQDRSFHPRTIAPAVNEEVVLPPWPSYFRQAQSQDTVSDSLTHHNGEIVERRELFPRPIQAPRSKGSVSSGSGNSDTRAPSVSPRPTRLSLTGISNLRESPNRILSEPDPNGQVLLRPRGFPVFQGDLPSTLSTQSTSTRFSPFSDSDEGIEQDAPTSADIPNSASSLSPSSYIPSSLINSLDSAGGFDNFGLSRSFQSDEDTVLSRDWRKAASFAHPLPVENPSTGLSMYTTSPSSLTCPTFDGVDKDDPFEVRLPPTRHRFASEFMDLQRATLPPTRTISDPSHPPVDIDSQVKMGLAHKRWSSQQDAGKEKKGLNPEAKAFSLTKKSFPSVFSSSQHAFDPLGHPSSHSLPSLASSSLSSHSSLSIPSMPSSLTAEQDNLFSSISMRAFAPSPAEREALQRALGSSTNTSLERLPTLSEVSSVSSIPSLSLPSSPSHTHAHPAGPPGLGGNAGLLGAGVRAGVGASKDAVGLSFGLGGGRTLLGPSLAWLQSLPRVRKPKFSPWEDEETKELEAGGGEQ